MTQVKLFDAARTCAVMILVALSALMVSPSISHAEQFVLFDVTFTYTKEDADNSKPSKSHYYVREKLLNPNRPKDWTDPVDYRNGTLHIRTEVLDKPPGGEPTTWSICYIPYKGQKNGYGCTGTVLYREKGVYEQDVSMKSFWQNDSIVWSEGIKQIDLVIKDNSGGSGHAHKRADSEKFFPTKMRITVVQVSAGSKYDPSLVPDLPASRREESGVVKDRGSDREDAPISQQARTAIERGLVFLEKDASKWREEKKCSTCHHGLMTVWAYTEAKNQGFPIAPDTMRETLEWTKGRLLERIDLPRDTRPGWSMVNTSAMYLAIMAQSVASQEAVSPQELARISDHLTRHQEADGSWAWSSAPPVNRPPPFFESDEVATLLASMALAPHVPADSDEKSSARDSGDKAAAWLKQFEPTDTTQAAALRLLMKVRTNDSPELIRAGIEELLTRQNEDGGWGQLKELQSDAYATGQVLYVLNLSGLDRNSKAVQRGVAFLIAQQSEDGSWPMTRRGHPGVTPSANTEPIKYFGSAWAMLGLLRSR